MKKFRILTVVLTLLLALVVVSVVHAAPAAQAPADPVLELILKTVTSWGFGAVILLVVEIAKRAGLIPDGWAGKVSVLANLGVYVVITTAGVFGVDLLTDDLSTVLTWIVRLGELLLDIMASPVLYNVFRRAEVINPVPLSRRAGYSP